MLWLGHSQLIASASSAVYLVQCLKDEDVDATWDIENHVMSYNGETVAWFIQLGRAIVVTHGSLKEQYGTSAYIIKGEDSQYRIVGLNIAPRFPDNQNSLRIKLAACYIMVLAIKAICEEHDITQGIVELGCDNDEALQCAIPLTTFTLI